MNDQRPSIHKMMMEVAGVVAKRATCPEAHVGAVIATQDGRILSIGYNGSPRGFPHCTDHGCFKDENGHHILLIHAEQNAVINAAREGVSTKNAILYTTRPPCAHCAAVLIQAGIVKVVWIKNGNQSITVAALDILRIGRIEIMQMENNDE